MQTVQHAGDQSPGDQVSAGDYGIFANPGRISLSKIGWLRPVGSGFLAKVEQASTENISYVRLEISEFRLSQASALFLLQGASVRTLFSSTHFAESLERGLFELVNADVPRLWRPPPTIQKLILATNIQGADRYSAEEVFKELLLREIL